MPRTACTDPAEIAGRVPPLSEVIRQWKLFLSDTYPEAEYATIVVNMGDKLPCATIVIAGDGEK